MSLDFLHSYMLGNYRDLYAAALALNINEHNAALIVRRLLESAKEAIPEQRRTEGRLIARRLAALPPHRVYRLFRGLRRAGTAPVSPDISVEVDDVDAAYEAMRVPGAEIVHPLQDEEWGVRRFFVRDPGGRVDNVLGHR